MEHLRLFHAVFLGWWEVINVGRYAKRGATSKIIQDTIYHEDDTLAYQIGHHLGNELPIIVTEKEIAQIVRADFILQEYW